MIALSSSGEIALVLSVVLKAEVTASFIGCRALLYCLASLYASDCVTECPRGRCLSRSGIEGMFCGGL